MRSADGLVQIGSLRMLTGGYPEAGEAFAAARGAFVTLEDRGEVAACDANLANLAYMQGRFAEAAGIVTSKPTRYSSG